MAAPVRFLANTGYFRNFAISQVKVKMSLTCSFQILHLTIVNSRPQSVEARVSEMRTKHRPIFIIIRLLFGQTALTLHRVL